MSNGIAAAVRARRSATSTGFSAATRSRANSLTALASPCGGAGTVNLGMDNLVLLSFGPSCSPASSTRRTGAIGGVIAIL